ncbi:MAG: hypothetical protein JO110_00575 [Acetobacteraceae bacterium]|nr:hypothetical protein [Acetobacteraceae bacterium]
MSETTTVPAPAGASAPPAPVTGPALGAKVNEVIAYFRDCDSMESAIAELGMAGFDRSDLSLPHFKSGSIEEEGPDTGADAPETDDDRRQIRTLQTSLVAATAALVACAVVAFFSDSWALTIIAAIVAGVTSGFAVEVLARRYDRLRHDIRDTAGRCGDLVLAVRICDPAKNATVEKLLSKAGATRVVFLTRDVGGAVQDLRVLTDAPIETDVVWLPGIRMIVRAWEWATGKQLER